MEVDDEGSDSPMNMDDERNVQAEDLLSEPLPTIDRAEPWHAQFPTSWLPIITRDIARQRRQVSFIFMSLHKLLICQFCQFCQFCVIHRALSRHIQTLTSVVCPRSDEKF